MAGTCVEKIGDDELISVILSCTEYEPDTGNIYWTVDRAHNKKIRKLASYTDKTRNYKQIRVCNILLQQHRVAFVHMTGRFPEEGVDHINGITTDNRWCNIREASALINNRNAKMHKTNTSGIMGVSQCRNGYADGRPKFEAYISLHNRKIGLGFYDNLFDAACARLSKQKELGFHENHGREG